MKYAKRHYLSVAVWRIYAIVNKPSFVAILARRLFSTKTLSHPMPNIANWVIENNREWNFAVQGIVCKMATILFPPRYINNQMKKYIRHDTYTYIVCWKIRSMAFCYSLEKQIRQIIYWFCMLKESIRWQCVRIYHTSYPNIIPFTLRYVEICMP